MVFIFSGEGKGTEVYILHTLCLRSVVRSYKMSLTRKEVKSE